ncbi:MAG: hypothetical protein K1Y36_12490 [Blastocatellia bacterium]|nr:hypothetical protein [Blastocatellia bacterium]
MNSFLTQTPLSIEHLKRDQERGMLHDHRHERVFLMTEDPVRALHTAFRDQWGPKAAEMLYSFGRSWGEQLFSPIAARIEMRRPGIRSIAELSVRDFVKTCDEIWAERGWGHVELVQAHGQIFINLYNSPIAQMLGETQEPADHVFAGIFAGIFSRLSGTHLECIELFCLAHGASSCRFLQGGAPMIESVRNLQAQGASYESILRILQQNNQS